MSQGLKTAGCIAGWVEAEAGVRSLNGWDAALNVVQEGVDAKLPMEDGPAGDGVGAVKGGIGEASPDAAEVRTGLRLRAPIP